MKFSEEQTRKIMLACVGIMNEMGIKKTRVEKDTGVFVRAYIGGRCKCLSAENYQKLKDYFGAYYNDEFWLNGGYAYYVKLIEKRFKVRIISKCSSFDYRRVIDRMKSNLCELNDVLELLGDDIQYTEAPWMGGEM